MIWHIPSPKSSVQLYLEHHSPSWPKTLPRRATNEARFGHGDRNSTGGRGISAATALPHAVGHVAGVGGGHCCFWGGRRGEAAAGCAASPAGGGGGAGAPCVQAPEPAPRRRLLPVPPQGEAWPRLLYTSS